MNLSRDQESLIVPTPVKPVMFYLLVPAFPLDPLPAGRKAKVQKYLLKKQFRNFHKRVIYKSRQAQACRRERSKGKFVKTDAESFSRKTTEDDESLA